MRKFSPEVELLLKQDRVVGFFLVQWGTGIETFTIRHTSFPYELIITDVLNLEPSFSNAEFRADNGLSSIDAPRLSDIVDREIYKISYIDNDLSMFNKIRERIGVYGAACKVWVGLINTTEGMLGDYAPGEPLRDAQHLIVAYKGTVDTYGITVNSDGAIITGFELASPMVALDLIRPIFTSQEAQQLINFSDACYNNLHINPATVTLKWGKL